MDNRSLYSYVKEAVTELEWNREVKALLDAIRRIHETPMATFRRLLDHYANCPGAREEDEDYLHLPGHPLHRDRR